MVFTSIKYSTAELVCVPAAVRIVQCLADFSRLSANSYY